MILCFIMLIYLAGLLGYPVFNSLFVAFKPVSWRAQINILILAALTAHSPRN